jgi:acetyltransferase-like isoleucine patch superfamily enzyme
VRIRRWGFRRAARAATAPLAHAAWHWVERFGVIAPRDRRARRYRAFGDGTAVAFPPGAVFGEHWIALGASTLVAPHVSMSVGYPIERLDPDRPAVIVIGDRCTIGRGSALVARRGIVVEDDVIMAPNVYVTDHNHGYEDVSLPIWKQMPVEAPVRIGAGSWLGANVVVLPGADIGRNVTVAAGSVVRGTVPDHCVVAGAPAEVVRVHEPGTGWVAARDRPEANLGLVEGAVPIRRLVD